MPGGEKAGISIPFSAGAGIRMYASSRGLLGAVLHVPRDARRVRDVNRHCEISGRSGSDGYEVTRFQITFCERAWPLQTRNAPNGAKPKCRQTRVRSTTNQASAD